MQNLQAGMQEWSKAVVGTLIALLGGNSGKELCPPLLGALRLWPCRGDAMRTSGSASCATKAG